MRTKNQRYAEAVMPNVLDVVDTYDEDFQKKYKTLTKKAGSLVRNSGLMQTLAFFCARGQKDKDKHYQVLLKHLEQELQGLKLMLCTENLYQVVREAEVPHYMVLTREVILLLNWHKRLAETLIIVEEQKQHAQEEAAP